MPTKLKDQKNFAEVNKSVLESLERDQEEAKHSNFPNPEDATSSTHQPDETSANSVQQLRKKKKKFSLGRFISLTIIIFCVGFFAVGGAFVYNILAAVSESTGGGEGNIWDTFTGALNPQGFERVELKGEPESRTNMLVLGVDSEALLSDTVMVVSYYHTEQKIATLSIPRDFYVTDGYGSYRINAIYPFAEARSPGSGAQTVADFVSRELDIPIHYWVVVNFEGVEQIVNAVGGIEIDVTVPFVDYQFPTRNYSGYMRPAPSFEKGKQKMNGERALIYARSRHGNNGTGSDFDRGRRQAEVGEAILQKLKQQVDSGEIMNINSINALIASAKNNIKTSAKINEIMSAYELFKETAAEQEDIMSNYYSINWQAGNGFLCTPPLEKYGASVVTYCDGAIGGTNYASASRERGRQQAKNLLAEARFADLANTSTIILANQSKLTGQVEAELKKMPLGTVWPADNNYRYISKASGQEKVSIYIPNKNLRSQFEEAAKGQLNFAFELKGDLPTDKTLMTNNQGTDIVVWIE
jgi:LCP family protein required for cell wall assembly